MEDREPEPEPEPARVPARKKTQRKPKKEVPVGRNGLKKRRVVKSRMTTDEKGYFGASASVNCGGHVVRVWIDVTRREKLLRIIRRTSLWTRRRRRRLQNPRKGKERRKALLLSR